MPDPYRKYSPGQRLPTDAATFSGFARASRAERDRQNDQKFGDLEQTRRGDLVRVLNDTGGDLDRLSVVGLDGPIFEPGDSTEAFLREVAFRGIVPEDEHRGKFAVLLEPAPAGQVVRGWVAGVTPVRVEMTDPSHTCADVVPGDTSMLRSAESGSAQVLWFDPDGAHSYGGEPGPWGIVRLASTCSGGGGDFIDDRCDCPEATYEVSVECGLCANAYGPYRMPRFWELSITAARESEYYGYSGMPCPNTECSWVVGSLVVLEYEADSLCTWYGEGRCVKVELRYIPEPPPHWQLTIVDHEDCVLAVYVLSDMDLFVCCGANTHRFPVDGYESPDWIPLGESPCEFEFNFRPHDCTCCPELDTCESAAPDFVFCSDTDCCYINNCTITVTVGNLFSPPPIPCGLFDPVCYDSEGNECPYPPGDPGRLSCWSSLSDGPTGCGGMNGAYAFTFESDCTWVFEGVPGGGSAFVSGTLTLSQFLWRMELYGENGQVAVFTSDECEPDWHCERFVELCFVEAESTCGAVEPAPNAVFTLALPG